MPSKPKKKRENRSITVDFDNENKYFGLIKDGKAFLEFIIVFIQMIGFQLKHKVGCSGGFKLTRHSSYERIRLNGLEIWRIQCKNCKAVFTVLPHFVLRYSSVKPEEAQKALTATHYGMSLEVFSCRLRCPSHGSLSAYLYIRQSTEGRKRRKM